MQKVLDLIGMAGLGASGMRVTRHVVERAGVLSAEVAVAGVGLAAEVGDDDLVLGGVAGQVEEQAGFRLVGHGPVAVPGGRGDGKGLVEVRIAVLLSFLIRNIYSIFRTIF